jgi:hypothetical protein
VENFFPFGPKRGRVRFDTTAENKRVKVANALGTALAMGTALAVFDRTEVAGRGSIALQHLRLNRRQGGKPQHGNPHWTEAKSNGVS